jgi:predicted O-methyltransferase YrrM
VESRLRPGAFIVAENIDNSPEYVARVRSPENGYSSFPRRCGAVDADW